MPREILALAGKDVRLLIRDRGGAVVTFIFPFIYCVFFGLIFSTRSNSNSHLRIVVVDEDQTTASTAFVTALDAADEFEVIHMPREEAVNAVRRGKQVAYLALPKGFGQASENLFSNQRPRIEVGVDPARSAEAAMLRGLLTKYAFESITSKLSNTKSMEQQLNLSRAQIKNDTQLSIVSRFAYNQFFDEAQRLLTTVDAEKMADKNPNEGSNDPGKTSKISSETSNAAGEASNTDGSASGWQPIDFVAADVIRERVGPQNSYDISFPQGIIWGVLGCCSSFGISLVNERTSGTLSRLRVAPIGRTKILAGKALACFGSIVFLSVVLFVVGRLFFDVSPKSLGHLAVSLVTIAVAFVGIMMFISILGKTERSVSGFGWGVLLGMAMLGGGMVPRMFMPPLMQSLSHLSPVKWAILAMEGAVWRDFSTQEMLLPWVVLLSVGVVFFAIGVKGFAWMDEG